MTTNQTIWTAEFKEAVLSCLVQDLPFLREAVSTLKPEYFEETIHAAAAESILQSYLATQALPSRAGLLNDITNKLASSMRLKEKDQERKLALKPAQELVERLFRNREGTLEDVKAAYLEWTRSSEMLSTVAQVFNDLGAKKIDCNAAMSTIRQTYLRVNASHDVGIEFFKDGVDDGLTTDPRKVATTGFPSLDRKMGDGGPTPGTLTTLIAPPKGGKSMILVNIGYANLVRGKTVVSFTLEISGRKLKKRYVSRVTHIPLEELGFREGEAKNKLLDFQKIHKGRLFIKEYLYGKPSVDTFKSYLHWLEGTTGTRADVVIVDYGDLVSAANRRGGDEERFVQKAAYEDLRAMAAEFNCAVFTASQCNRESVNKKIIKMSDIAEAFAKCAISDHIISICQDDEEAKSRRARLFFAGSREGETGMCFPVTADWASCTMTEVRNAPKDDTSEWVKL